MRPSQRKQVATERLGGEGCEIQGIAASLEPGSSAGFVLIEHVWARKLKRAIRETDGFPLGEGFLTPEALADIAADLVAMAEIIDALEREQAEAGV